MLVLGFKEIKARVSLVDMHYLIAEFQNVGFADVPTLNLLQWLTTPYQSVNSVVDRAVAHKAYMSCSAGYRFWSRFESD